MGTCDEKRLGIYIGMRTIADWNIQGCRCKGRRGGEGQCPKGRGLDSVSRSQLEETVGEEVYDRGAQMSNVVRKPDIKVGQGRRILTVNSSALAPGHTQVQ